MSISSGGDAVDTHHILINASWNKKCLSKCVTHHHYTPSLHLSNLEGNTTLKPMTNRWWNAVSHSAEVDLVSSRPSLYVWLLRGGLLPLWYARQGWWGARYVLPNRYHLPHYLWCNDAGHRLVIIPLQYGVGQFLLWNQHNITYSLSLMNSIPSSANNFCHLVVCMGENTSPWRILGERNLPIWWTSSHIIGYPTVSEPMQFLWILCCGGVSSR